MTISDILLYLCGLSNDMEEAGKHYTDVYKMETKEVPKMSQNLKHVIFYIRNAHAIYKKSRGERIRVGESSGNHLIRHS